jgi:hypothetical protein
MLIDNTHKPWAVASIVIVAVSTIIYVPYAAVSAHGAKGGSALGLTYGIIGFAMMIFAGLLGARKKVPVWRLGRAQAWMRGHLWLGLISLPIILFHAGFHFGGALTATLMWLFIIVVVSGVFGAALQHFLPRLLLNQVPMETIYEQIESVAEQLLTEADALAASAVPEIDMAMARTQMGDSSTAIATEIDVDQPAVDELNSFYKQTLRPYLERVGGRGLELANLRRAKEMFQQERILLPAGLYSALDDLDNICEEKRELDQQKRLHAILHGWLLCHVPLSVALLLLGAVHAALALRY